ncbi:MAG: aryl-sulfate sulfotransferase [Planctomycetes bacterium]|nr:aryl-sulfate sulfotransferase [Planctomycetota bacterium]
MRSLFFSLATVVLALTGCTDTSDSPPVGPAVVSPRPGGVVNVATPTLELAPIFSAIYWEVVITPETGLDEDPIRLTVRELTSTLPPLGDGDYRLEYEAFDALGGTVAVGPVTHFRVLRTPEVFPELDVTVADTGSAQPGYRLINFIGGPNGYVQMLALVNLRGEVVWWYEGADFPGLFMAPTVLDDGSGILVIFAGGQIQAQRLTGRVVRLGWDGAIEYLTPETVVAHHECDVLPDGRYAYLGFTWREFEGNVIEGDTINIIDPVTGDLQWSWDIFDHITPIDWPTPEQTALGFSGYGGDWSHSNGFDWDPTNSVFWLSVRHFDALLGVHYPTGEVRYILGYSALPGLPGIGGPDLMRHQHAPEVQADGSILLWDNGNGRLNPVSKAERFSFDLTARTVDTEFSWDEGAFDPAIGDADRLPNGHYQITHGIRPKIIEVDEQGQKVWELSGPQGGSWWFYRSDWVPAELVPAALRTAD